ncbi:QueT transporter family protein [Lacticaseibacillus yichunensis]|uniref:QueT transporter family protein n=1 Tax=Lacticaseibacillus yichunensis TaxID=2486015 RepID=A0ABW4CSV7_9LACO|nr:QueT transporter family protein [Lacticaseibacillus yichunensis]
MQNSVSTRSSLLHLTQVAIVASLYVAVTVLLTPFSFGAGQIRASEMLNYTALYNKRYVVAVTLGVFIANFFSPTAVIDVPVGTIGTLIFLLLSRWLAGYCNKWWQKYLVMGVLFTVSMFTVAAQLAIVYHMPFWASYPVIMAGEAISMTIGAFVMPIVAKAVHLDR